MPGIALSGCVGAFLVAKGAVMNSIDFRFPIRIVLRESGEKYEGTLITLHLKYGECEAELITKHSTVIKIKLPSDLLFEQDIEALELPK
jgi:hypothetical protein